MNKDIKILIKLYFVNKLIINATNIVNNTSIIAILNIL